MQKTCLKTLFNARKQLKNADLMQKTAIKTA
jgi:hypothetical protein